MIHRTSLDNFLAIKIPYIIWLWLCRVNEIQGELHKNSSETETWNHMCLMKKQLITISWQLIWKYDVSVLIKSYSYLWWINTEEHSHTRTECPRGPSNQTDASCRHCFCYSHDTSLLHSWTALATEAHFAKICLWVVSLKLLLFSLFFSLSLSLSPHLHHHLSPIP